jgi:Xaa-Pro aminopeptidase
MTQIYETRLADVRDRFDEWQVDGLLISSRSNGRWLSGFTGSSGWLLITGCEAFLATDFRYWTQAAEEARSFRLFKLRGALEGSLAELIGSAGVSRIGIETGQITVRDFDRYVALDLGVEWVKLGETVETMREVKSAVEIAAIRGAAAITDAVMAQVNELARPGMSEAQLAWELEKRLRKAGASGMAFDIIVAGGPNSAKAHHHPGQRPLQPGEPIIVDMGAKLDGYNSDLTRSFHLGDNPNQQFWNVYGVVDEAGRHALQNAQPGMTGQEVDALAREMIAAAGYGDYFGHSLGHGVGLDVHEGPRLAATAVDSPVPVGSVVTIEPGIYLPDWGGIRIEELVVMTEQGAERISQCPRTPIIPL